MGCKSEPHVLECYTPCMLKTNRSSSRWAVIC